MKISRLGDWARPTQNWDIRFSALKCRFPWLRHSSFPWSPLFISHWMFVSWHSGHELIFHSEILQAGNFISITLRGGMHETSELQFKENGRMKLCPPTSLPASHPHPNHFSTCLTANQIQAYMREETFAGIFYAKCSQGQRLPQNSRPYIAHERSSAP